MKRMYFLLLGTLFLLPATLSAQHQHLPATVQPSMDPISNVEPQPLLSQAGRLADALYFLGSSLSPEDASKLDKLKSRRPDSSTTRAVQDILDAYCLAFVHINPETRVMVNRGPAKGILMQGGWTSYLIKVFNESGTNARLEVQSANAAPILYASANSPHAAPEHVLTQGQVANRFLEMQIFRNRPMEPNLSGLKLEYIILQIYSRDKGQREAEIGFNIGQGTQDIGYRNATSILFNIKPSVRVKLHVTDDNGEPVMGSFVITDGIEREMEAGLKDIHPVDYRLVKAKKEFGFLSKKLTGIYPLPSRRMALCDEYPDFFFEPQIYRSDGEHVFLSPGNYQFRFTRGPEYLMQTKQITIPSGVDSVEESFHLKRWINLNSLGWYSADHHLHAAGCSHYESPEEGVDPPAMFRQALGEDLDMATILSWGPGWYHQKKFFTGNIHPLSNGQNIMRYDVEVSGFPSSHAGHLVLLNLTEDDYPGSAKIEDWPSWTLPILSWAKAQGGLTGYAHSGWGLEPETPTNDLPNYIMPKMDGIGANEYIVTVTQNAVDIFSAGDTPAPWELNMWYHTLNCGFRPRLSGETDFPCIFDGRVGIARSYFKPTDGLFYPGYIEAIKSGRSYISDGRSHIIDFSVNGLEMGTHGSELALDQPGTIQVTAKVAAYLSPEQDEDGAAVAQRPLDEPPYWNTERARIKKTRRVPVELIVNGVPVDTMQVVADGKWTMLNFKYAIKRSSWVALRIFPSAHSNPVFVVVDRKPILIRESAEWCRKAVDKCWQTKEPNIRAEEREDAKAAYNKAREIYDEMIRESR
ncbi:MAG TPA: CehA/McbA family metallohydrolase [Puia sp.]|nr:CehA/McbA family metallohydrolase [Puia sp.]